MEKVSELDTHKNIDIMRERYEKIIKLPAEDRTSHDLFELMLFTSSMSIFEEIKMSKIHEELCKYIRLKNFEIGEIIFKQGDEGDNYYFILNGAVDLFIFDIDDLTGKTILSLNKNCYAGEGFGELAIKFDCPRSFTAVSVTHSTCLFIGKKIYKEHVNDFHEKKLFELIKFMTSISVFKKENIKNIIKYCIKSTKEKLNSYKPFIKYHEYLNRYVIISTGVIKCFYKIKVTKTFLENSINLPEDDFIQYLTNLQSMEVDKEVTYAEICKKKKSVAKFVKLFKERNYKALKEEKEESTLVSIKNNDDERNLLYNEGSLNNNNNNDIKKNERSSFLLNLKIGKNEDYKIDIIKEEEDNNNNDDDDSNNFNDNDNKENKENKEKKITFSFKNFIEKSKLINNNINNNNNSNGNININTNTILNANDNNSLINSNSNNNGNEKANNTLRKSKINFLSKLNTTYKTERDKLNILSSEDYNNNNNNINNNDTKEIKSDNLISQVSNRINTLKSGASSDTNKILNDYEREESIFPNCQSNNKRGKDIVYNEIIEIMEFIEKDMVGEYYASKSKKIDVFLLPVLPTEIYSIRTDEFREIFPDIDKAIKEYSRPIFESKRIFRKLHNSMKWNNTKKDLLKMNVLSNK
jgi:hypothetical protein